MPVRQQIINVFHNSFSASEGESEGALIRTLVEHLLENSPEPDIFIFATLHDDTVIGCGIFSCLTYSDDVRNVIILSPMASHPDHQNKGIGQTLLRESIAALRTHGIDILMTDGDPNYYGKIGFLHVIEQVAPTPFPLSMPIGWIGQSLHGSEISPLQGSCTCVSALNNPAIWKGRFTLFFTQHCVIAIQVHFVIIASPYVSARYAILMASTFC